MQYPSDQHSLLYQQGVCGGGGVLLPRADFDGAGVLAEMPLPPVLRRSAEWPGDLAVLDAAGILAAEELLSSPSVPEEEPLSGP